MQKPLRGGKAPKGRYWSNAKTEVWCDLERSRVDVKLRQKLKVGRRWPKSFSAGGHLEKIPAWKAVLVPKSRADACDRGLQAIVA